MTRDGVREMVMTRDMWDEEIISIYAFALTHYVGILAASGATNGSHQQQADRQIVETAARPSYHLQRCPASLVQTTRNCLPVFVPF
jgi:hypothetical protein